MIMILFLMMKVINYTLVFFFYLFLPSSKHKAEEDRGEEENRERRLKECLEDKEGHHKICTL